MATLTIRNIDEPTKARLRVRAAQNGRSMEEEARQILRVAIASPAGETESLADAIRRRFSDLGGVDLPTAPRGPMRPPPTFDR